jgi:argininosuccinate synthase
MKKIVLAFSGGLDTSFCVPYLIDQGFEVHTIFVNSGGTSASEEKKISKRAYELGAKKTYKCEYRDKSLEGDN